MALVDSIIGAESGGLPHMTQKFAAHTLVGKLLLAGRPSAVIRGVISVTVDAVNRMQFRRLLSHVGKKVLKTVAPSVANLNATRSVKSVGDVFLVGAASNHAHPRMIFCRGLSAARNRNRPAVRRVGSFGGFNFPATTTHCVARAKIWNRYIGRVSAIAPARIPADFGSSICSNLWRRLANGYKPSEPLAGAIYGSCH